MADQPLVSQEIQDQIDGKLPEAKPPITGNQRILDDLENKRRLHELHTIIDDEPDN